MTAPPAIFLSHSHQDKRAARRLARELRPYGFPVWIDEAELRFGAQLGATLQARIEESDVVVVVASEASARSTWVALEIRHAQEHGKPVVPLYVESVTDVEPFADLFGVDDAIAPTSFVTAAHTLMSSLLSVPGPRPGDPDPAIIEAGLRACAAEEPDVRPLIEGYLDGPGVGYEQTAFYDAPFLVLDYALYALLELMQTEPVAWSAAHGLRRAGAGPAALARWIELSGDGGLPLQFAVDLPLASDLIDPALDLLRGCDPPNNLAVAKFIRHNSGQLTAGQQSATLTLVTWPERGPENFGDVLGGVALRHFRGAPEIVRLWRRWIWAGSFDGRPSLLAGQLAEAEAEHVPGLPELYEALRSHVRNYLRSGDEQKIVFAVAHLRAHVDKQTGAVAALCAEAFGVGGTSEWERWAERDPDTADRMEHYVHAHLEEAQAGGDWPRALTSWRHTMEIDEQRRKLNLDERAKAGRADPSDDSHVDEKGAVVSAGNAVGHLVMAGIKKAAANKAVRDFVVAGTTAALTQGLATAKAKLPAEVRARNPIIAVTGLGGTGKTVLVHHLCNRDYQPLPYASVVVEKVAKRSLLKGLHFRIIPGHGAAARRKGLEEVLSSGVADGVIHVVADGLATVRDDGSTAAPVQANLDAYRGAQRDREVADFRETAAHIAALVAASTKPIWLLIAVTKTDLLPPDLATDIVANYYSVHGHSPFAEALRSMLREVGEGNITIATMPVYSTAQDFTFGTEVIPTRGNAEDCATQLDAFLKRVRFLLGQLS